MKSVPRRYVVRMKPPQGGKAFAVGNWRDCVKTAKAFLDIGSDKVTISKLKPQ